MKLTLLSGFFLLLFVSAASAQDVCCFLGKKAEDGGAEVAAMTMSAKECQVGKTVNEMRVCSGMPDPSNVCPNSSLEQRCKNCGFYFNGTICLAENPVEKAKKELHDEVKKEVQDEMKKTPVPSPSPAPKK